LALAAALAGTAMLVHDGLSLPEATCKPSTFRIPMGRHPRPGRGTR